ncbi:MULTISPECIES: hypothetical protein [unclassified Curtobacterium]|uniref:hypothetical protein n=1 Tax=unclassified Curtobacterium TaxID=257496 RepID=UPI00104BB13A|nr:MULTISPECIES: hypothetical protein [unclassified Curtobacterium]TCL81229.1 hypothetical protein EDF23_101678 [Curtobacterium sp. PhB128]TCL99354.1 hypothetical protein EDF29_101679 [Curtobacterium sp. PhB138]
MADPPRPQCSGPRVEGFRPDLVRGIPVSPPPRAWFESASLLTPTELVVLGDYLVGPRGLATIDGLAAAVVAGSRSARRRRTFQHDQRRSNGFAVNGWIVIHATAADTGRPAVLFERLRQAFVQRQVEGRARRAA